MKAKNAYRQEMEQGRLSEEKKNETLQRMLEKNQALRKQEAEPFTADQYFLIHRYSPSMIILVL